MYGCLGLKKKKEQKQGGNHSHLDHSYNPDSKRKSDKKTRELSPDDSGELRALGTLSLSIVAKINPNISIITRPHPLQEGIFKTTKDASVAHYALKDHCP